MAMRLKMLMEKMQDLKVQNYALLWGFTEDFSLDTVSQVGLKTVFRGKGGARINRNFCKKRQTNNNPPKKAQVVNIKRYPPTKGKPDISS